MTPRDYALIAQEAYSAKPDIGNADSASRAIVRDTPDGLVVAFPGTDNLQCVIADADILTVAVAGAGEVHRGFWDAWLAIGFYVEKAIGERPVTFVGHSLGAALAVMAAVTHCIFAKPVKAVYGFESPRVSPSNDIAALLTGVPLYLCKNGNDLVPDVPLGWKHAGQLVHIGQPLLSFPNVEDHSLDRVIAALAPPVSATQAA